MTKRNKTLKASFVIAIVLLSSFVSESQSEVLSNAEQKMPSGFFCKYGMEYLSFKSRDRAYSEFTRLYPLSLGIGYKIANTNFSAISLTIDRTFFGDGYIMPLLLHYDWYPSIYYKEIWGKDVFIGLGIGYLLTDLRTYLNEDLGNRIFEGHLGMDISHDVFWELKYSSYCTPKYQYYVDQWTLTYGHKI